MTTYKQTGKLPGTGLFGQLFLAILLTSVLCKPGVLASTGEKQIPKRVLAIFAFKQALPWGIRIDDTKEHVGIVYFKVKSRAGS